ncbi:hypothetical protein NQ318_003252 [Aromia moschata]|uniref:Uncharacterized protein n=1 Tax=Aromia moschata TaxID=1265417 RepID=A0AAV8XQ32_9CUCU|nr:hypothetical protein NQ318_003252 [Aromia moschata]
MCNKCDVGLYIFPCFNLKLKLIKFQQIVEVTDISVNQLAGTAKFAVWGAIWSEKSPSLKTTSAASLSASDLVAASAYTLTISSVPDGRTKARPLLYFDVKNKCKDQYLNFT